MEHMLVKWRKMWVRAVSLNGVSGGYMCRRVNQHPGHEERRDVSGFPGVTSQLFKCVFKSVCVLCAFLCSKVCLQAIAVRLIQHSLSCFLCFCPVTSVQSGYRLSVNTQPEGRAHIFLSHPINPSKQLTAIPCFIRVRVSRFEACSPVCVCLLASPCSSSYMDLIQKKDDDTHILFPLLLKMNF